MPRGTARQLARARGEKVYFSGTACLRGHVALRLVRNSECVKCKALAKHTRAIKQRAAAAAAAEAAAARRVEAYTPRRAAIAAGLPRYFTGRPCKRGHIAEIFVAGGCVVCTSNRVDRQRAILSGAADALRNLGVSVKRVRSPGLIAALRDLGINLNPPINSGERQ